MRPALAALYLVFWWNPALWASNTDSLLTLLRQQEEGTKERMELLYQISIAFRNTQPSQAISYGEALIEAAKMASSSEYLFLGFMSTGVAHALKGSDYPMAQRYFYDALEVANQFDSKDWQIRQVKAQMNLIGILYYQKEYDGAKQNTFQVIGKLEKLDQERLTLADAYQTMALIHKANKQHDSTLHYLYKCYPIYEALGADHQQLAALQIMGSALDEAGDYPKALDIQRRVLSTAQKQRDSSVLMNIYIQLGITYHHLKDYEKALQHLRQGLAYTYQFDRQPERLNALLSLSEVFSDIGQADSALHYYKNHVELNNEKQDQEKQKQLKDLESKYQLVQKEQENLALAQQGDILRKRNILLLAGSILLLILTLISFYFYRRIKQQKVELETLNEEVVSINTRLRVLMNEKKYMVSLLAHDIRTPLALIQLNASLLSNAKMSMGEREQFIAEIEEATYKIDKAGRKIMEIENRSDEKLEIQHIIFEVNKILEDSVAEFQTYAKKKEIELNIQQKAKKIFMEGDPFLLQHIIANLMSNAIKFSPYNEKINVVLEEKDDQLNIRVEDQGPGLPEDVQSKLFHSSIKGSTKEGRGQGLFLTNRYVSAMSGRIAVSSQPGEGAVFSLTFPLKYME
ncbi:MAG TPA: tetratricopeptide repeat-containing sensor histidine kinase [Saprospiraceae bacterium]|nr:tetratricopeptide repeat-containing sensor histidine kinase [Saprospiraceae bacterium]HMQ82991.1 tetratricopeptide repeat-containing sensor histidine kinase [Saprospiraceae bacterium]